MEPKEKTQQPQDPQDQFLDQVRVMVDYWAGEIHTLPADQTCRDQLEGLAHGILTILDGGGAAGGFLPLAEGRQAQDEPGGGHLREVIESNIAGDLNDRLFNRGRWEHPGHDNPPG